MPTITREFQFDAAHRVLGHEGKCRHLHGHRYRAEVTVYAPALDELGRVIDFSVIKEKIGKWIEYSWDHTIILHPDDPLFDLIWGTDKAYPIFAGKKPYLLHVTGVAANPTAENLAHVLYEESQMLFFDDIRIVSVRMWETPSCSAIYPDVPVQ